MWSVISCLCDPTAGLYCTHLQPALYGSYVIEHFSKLPHLLYIMQLTILQLYWWYCIATYFAVHALLYCSSQLPLYCSQCRAPSHLLTAANVLQFPVTCLYVDHVVFSLLRGECMGCNKETLTSLLHAVPLLQTMQSLLYCSHTKTTCMQSNYPIFSHIVKIVKFVNDG